MDSSQRAARIVRTIVGALQPRFAVELWTGERIGPETDRSCRIADSQAVRRIVRRPTFDTLLKLWTSKAVDVEDGTLFDIVALRPEGSLKARLRALPKLQLSARRARAAAFRRRQVGRRVAGRPGPVRQRLRQARDPASLRHFQRVLPALPRQPHGLQLRLLQGFRQRHRPGPGRQARAHLPQAAAEAGRPAARHRLRLGCDADPRRQAPWRHRPRRVAVGGADRTGPRTHPRRGAGRPHHHRDQILYRPRRQLRQDLVDRHVRAYRARQSRDLFQDDPPPAQAGRHLSAPCDHAALQAGQEARESAVQGVAEIYLPRRRGRPYRHDAVEPRTAPFRGPGRREPARCTMRAPAGSGPSGCRPGSTKPSARSARTGRGCGCSTSPAARSASSAARSRYSRPSPRGAGAGRQACRRPAPTFTGTAEPVSPSCSAGWRRDRRRRPDRRASRCRRARRNHPRRSCAGCGA